MGIEVPFTTVSDNAVAPAYAHVGDAGLDLCSTVACDLEPLHRETVPCGIAVAIPEGFAGLVIPRSGLASKHGISVVNAPGLIDSGYRGEIKVVLINLDPASTFHIDVGDRIAQLVITPVPEVTLVRTESLEETERGASGFGSSGVKGL